MKFARSPLPSLAQLKKMRERAFFDGMASAFDIMPTVRPPINLGIPVREALRSYYWAIANDFRRALGWKPIELPQPTQSSSQED